MNDKKGYGTWATVDEAMETFRLGRSLMYEMMSDRTLPYLPVGKRGRRVRLEDVESALRERSKKTLEIKS